MDKLACCRVSISEAHCTKTNFHAAQYMSAICDYLGHVGAWLVMHNSNFTIGMLVAFQMLSDRLSGPVLRLVGLWQEFQQAFSA